MNIVRQCHMMLWSSMRESIQVFFKGGLKDNHYCVSCIDKLKVLYQSKMKFASNGHLPSFIFLILWNKYPFPKIHNIHNAGILDLFKLSRLRAWNFALNSLIKLFLRTLPSYDHSINIKTYIKTARQTFNYKNHLHLPPKICERLKEGRTLT